MKKIHLLSSAIVVGVMLAASGNIFNTQLFASNITKVSLLEAKTDEGKRLEIIHRFMEELNNSATAAPKIVKKLNALKLVPYSIISTSSGVLATTIKKICDLHEIRKLKKTLMSMDEDQKGQITELTAYINKLDPSYQLTAQEITIFKDLFEGIDANEIEEFS